VLVPNEELIHAHPKLERDGHERVPARHLVAGAQPDELAGVEQARVVEDVEGGAVDLRPVRSFELGEGGEAVLGGAGGEACAAVLDLQIKSS